MRPSAASCGPATPAPTPRPIRSPLPSTRITQIPAEHIEAIELLLRVDTAGATHGCWRAREHRVGYSVGYDLTDAVRAAILATPDTRLAGDERPRRH